MTKNEILTQVFRSKGVLVGSSTMNNVMMPKVAAMLEEITGLRFQNKKASAFGSYGWNGGAVDRIQTRLMDAGFETTLSLKTKWRPDGSALAICREHGREIARQWALHPLTVSPVTIDISPTPLAADTGISAEITAASPCACNSTSAPQYNGRMQCSVCQWIYDPAIGEPMQDVAPGTPWSDVPDTFLCPECSLGKDVFNPIN
ncbi:hypothetical protein DZS_11470 [Dickeya ananatis]